MLLWDCNITDAYLSLTSEPPVRKIKEEPKVEKEPPDNPVMLPPSDEAQFVHDLTQKVNLINKGFRFAKFYLYIHYFILFIKWICIAKLQLSFV